MTTRHKRVAVGLTRRQISLLQREFPDETLSRAVRVAVLEFLRSRGHRVEEEIEADTTFKSADFGALSE